jgi:putative MFS transporter
VADRTIALDDVPLNRFHIRVTAYSTGGMFCDGYILGIIGIALSVWSPQVGMSSLWDGLIGASALAGIFVGSLVFGPITDRVGRQTMYTADLVAFVVASAAQFFVQEPWQLFALRLIMGIAVGADYAIGAALLAEFLPRRQRGPLMACLNAVWTFGYVAAYVVGYLLRDLGPDSWRWMLASSAVPALIVLCLRLGTPESPRWLVGKGRVDEARAIIHRYFGTNVMVPEPEPEEQRTSLRELFTKRWRLRTAFASIFWFAQVLPFFALFTFAPQVLGALGIKGELTGGLLTNGFQLIGAVVGVVIMNMLPRRLFLWVSFLVMAVCLGALAVVPNAPTALVLGSFAVFALVVSASGNLETVYPSELFPTHIRATAVGFAASMSRVGAAVGTFLLPLSLEHLGNRLTMLIATIVLVVGLVVTLAWAPETRTALLDTEYYEGEGHRKEVAGGR